jgi:DNA-binding XRE family transcriptional regulator
VFAFPLRSGSVRIGALTLYQPVAGELSSEQYADAVVVARFALNLLTSLQAGRPPHELSDRAHRQTPAAVAELRAAGLTVRDVAQLLGVTPSRVSQIEKQDHLANWRNARVFYPSRSVDLSGSVLMAGAQ